MNPNEKSSKGYQIIEPELYEELNWEMDTITSCLEVIRTKLPELFEELPDSISFELLAYENPFGGAYPVIGLFSQNPKDFNALSDYLDLDEKVNNWLKNFGLDKIKTEAEKIEAVSWEKIKSHAAK